MRAHESRSRFGSFALLMTAMFAASGVVVPPAMAEVIDPLADGPVDPDLFDNAPVSAQGTTVHPAEYAPRQDSQKDVRTANYQTTSQTPFADDPAGTAAPPTPAALTGPVAAANDPCAATPTKPLSELGISIALPAGKLPTDLATACWEQINQKEGGRTARAWPLFCYNWDATCFYHRPLYFEEINLERYGYHCGDSCCYPYECCLQPAASAAHFFGTVPMLPYCIAADCPGDHIYTLGHYRPGSCPPLRWHWPSCTPIAALAEGGAWTALILVFP